MQKIPLHLSKKSADPYHPALFWALTAVLVCCYLILTMASGSTDPLVDGDVVFTIASDPFWGSMLTLAIIVITVGIAYLSPESSALALKERLQKSQSIRSTLIRTVVYFLALTLVMIAAVATMSYHLSITIGGPLYYFLVPGEMPMGSAFQRYADEILLIASLSALLSTWSISVSTVLWRKVMPAIAVFFIGVVLVDTAAQVAGFWGSEVSRSFQALIWICAATTIFIFHRRHRNVINRSWRKPKWIGTAAAYVAALFILTPALTPAVSITKTLDQMTMLIALSKGGDPAFTCGEEFHNNAVCWPVSLLQSAGIPVTAERVTALHALNGNLIALVSVRNLVAEINKSNNNFSFDQEQLAKVIAFSTRNHTSYLISLKQAGYPVERSWISTYDANDDKEAEDKISKRTLAEWLWLTDAGIQGRDKFMSEKKAKSAAESMPRITGMVNAVYASVDLLNPVSGEFSQSGLGLNDTDFMTLSPSVLIKMHEQFHEKLPSRHLLEPARHFAQAQEHWAGFGWDVVN